MPACGVPADDADLEFRKRAGWCFRWAVVHSPAAQSGKVAKQGHVVQCLFHGGVAECESLLHDVDAQHGLYREWRLPTPAFGCVRRDKANQFTQGTTCSLSARNAALRVRLAKVSSPRLACFMAEMASTHALHHNRICRGFTQSVLRFNHPLHAARA